MQSNSRIIVSSQLAPHEQLQSIVLKHQKSTYLKPIADHNRSAFERAQTYWRNVNKPKIILDSGCGTGDSTHHLAIQNPGHFVLGLDRSEVRLAKTKHHSAPENAFWLRCDCEDFWRLAEQAGWVIDQHYLLYPNPYPKATQFKRRWHGHPVFPTLVNISTKLELRTNWHVYAREFHQACKELGLKTELHPYHPRQALSAFENKYTLSHHELWRVKTQE